MSKLTRAPGWIAPLLASTFLLANCSDPGTTEAGLPADVSGFWKIWVTPEGEAEVGPTVLHFTQTGSDLDALDTTGTVSENRLLWHPGLSDLSTAETYLGTVSGDLASGTFTVVGLVSANGTWRAERFVPVGTMSASGTVAGLAVDVVGAPAVGALYFSDAQLLTPAEATVTFLDAGRGLELRFDATGLAVGTLEIPAVVAADVRFATDDEAHLLAGVAGTLEVTKFDGTGFAATFTIDVGGGEVVTGSFDVAFDVAAHRP